MSDYNYDEFVSEQHKQDALRRLDERIHAGHEDPEEILGITDEYYLNKIIQGLGPMSYTIYDRIMLCSAEDGQL